MKWRPIYITSLSLMAFSLTGGLLAALALGSAFRFWLWVILVACFGVFAQSAYHLGRAILEGR